MIDWDPCLSTLHQISRRILFESTKQSCYWYFHSDRLGNTEWTEDSLVSPQVLRLSTWSADRTVCVQDVPTPLLPPIFLWQCKGAAGGKSSSVHGSFVLLRLLLVSWQYFSSFFIQIRSIHLDYYKMSGRKLVLKLLSRNQLTSICNRCNVCCWIIVLELSCLDYYVWFHDPLLCCLIIHITVSDYNLMLSWIFDISGSTMMNNGGMYDSKTLYVGNLDHQVTSFILLPT